MNRISTFGASVILLLIAAFPLHVSASSDPPSQNPVLTLSDTIRLAVQQNPKTKASDLSIQQAEQRSIQAKSGYYPQISFSETINHTNNPMWAFGTRLNQEQISASDFDPGRLNDPDAITNFASVLSMEWEVFNGGRTRIGLDQANNQVKAASIQAVQTRQEVILQTIKAYAGLVLARQQLDVTQQAIATANAHLDMIQARFDNGFAVKSDLLRAQVRLADLEQTRLQSESGIQIAWSTLYHAMGIPVDQPARPLQDLPQNPAAPNGSLESWVNEAMSGQPMIQQIKIMESVAEQEIQKSKSAHLPNIALLANYEINSEKWKEFGDNYTVGAMMKFNLYSGDRISAKTRESEAGLKRIQALRQDLVSYVEVQTRQAWHQTQSAWNRIRVSKSAIQQAEEGLRIVANRYENGLYPLVSLLDAELSLQNSRTSHIQAIHDFLVARASLFLAAGTLNEDFQ